MTRSCIYFFLFKLNNINVAYLWFTTFCVIILTKTFERIAHYKVSVCVYIFELPVVYWKWPNFSCFPNTRGWLTFFFFEASNNAGFFPTTSANLLPNMYKSKRLSTSNHEYYYHDMYQPRWLYAFGAPYVLQCYMALKRVRRRKLLETPCNTGDERPTSKKEPLLCTIVTNVWGRRMAATCVCR